MRRTLYALLMALLPAATSAAPFAEYTPATGDITFHDVYNGHQVWLKSQAGRLNPAIAVLPTELVPADAKPPRTFHLSGTTSALWDNFTPPDHTAFQFSTLTIRGAIVPHTPLDDLTFLFHPSNAVMPRWAPIVSIPEPSTIALTAFSLSSIAAIQRRRVGQSGK